MNVKGKVKTLSIVVIWILVAGCSGDKEGTPGFFSGGAQSVDKRQIRDMPPARDSVSLLDLGVFEFEDFFVYGNDIYLPGYKGTDGKILAIDKETLAPGHVIGREEGQGPGQIQGGYGVVTNGHVVFYSAGQRKIAVYDTSGTFITDVRTEVPTSSVVPLGNRFVVMSDVVPVEQEGRPQLFHVVDMDGNVVNRFGPSGRSSLERADNPMAYLGQMAVDSSGNYLYFGSYPEPLLKKYEIGGGQVFSVKTIDNLPSEVNYVSQAGSGRQMWSYTDHALFSTEALAVFHDRLLVVPINDVQGNRLTYLDVYSAEDGSYVESYRMPNHVTGLAVDESNIYAKEKVSEGKFFLKVYENVLRGESR